MEDVAMIRRVNQYVVNWLSHWYVEILVMVELIKHPEISFLAKFYLLALLSYILSPVDFIPDFIPFFGHWDDIAAIPVIFFLIKRITPGELIEAVRMRVTTNPEIGFFKTTRSKFTAVIIVILWVLVTYWFALLLGLDPHLPI